VRSECRAADRDSCRGDLAFGGSRLSGGEFQRRRYERVEYRLQLFDPRAARRREFERREHEHRVAFARGVHARDQRLDIAAEALEFVDRLGVDVEAGVAE
jgi:hypothetical protein